MGAQDNKVYPIPLFQLRDNLTPEEGAEIQRIFDTFQDKVIFKYDINELSVMSFSNDLVADKKSVPVRFDSEKTEGILTAARGNGEDDAMGGIDLNPQAMGLDISRNGNGVEMFSDPAMAARLGKGHFGGVIPVILNIMPVHDPLSAFGLNPSAP